MIVEHGPVCYPSTKKWNISVNLLFDRASARFLLRVGSYCLKVSAGNFVWETEIAEKTSIVVSIHPLLCQVGCLPISYHGNGFLAQYVAFQHLWPVHKKFS